METLLSHSAYFWLGLGAFLIVFEAITTPGLGLFLAGIGALCTGLLVKAGFVDEGALGAKVAWFLGLTTFWAAVLWKPLLKFRMQSRHKDGIELNNRNRRRTRPRTRPDRTGGLVGDAHECRA
jgi:membrane protein implicated in regulation of membrane protease activity